jgi:hypothetical protein
MENHSSFHEALTLSLERGDLCVLCRRRRFSRAGRENYVNYSQFQCAVCCFQFLRLFSMSLTSA